MVERVGMAEGVGITPKVRDSRKRKELRIKWKKERERNKLWSGEVPVLRRIVG